MDNVFFFDDTLAVAVSLIICFEKPVSRNVRTFDVSFTALFLFLSTTERHISI